LSSLNETGFGCLKTGSDTGLFERFGVGTLATATLEAVFDVSGVLNCDILHVILRFPWENTQNPVGQAWNA
jgi:hypothetical protein